MTRHFLADDAVSVAEQAEILDLGTEMVKDPFRTSLENKSVAVLFDKTSTRTRFSFDVGINQLSGHPIVVDSGKSQMGKKESYQDTGAVLSRFVDAVVWRTGAHQNLHDMAETATVPIINALCDDFHPCQILADLLTIRQHKAGSDGSLRGIRAVYLGDGANNMANSYMLGFATAGVDLTIAAPDGFQPEQRFVDRAQARADETGATLKISDAPDVTGADVVITDTWVSMGMDADRDTGALVPFQVTEELMATADKDAVFMHCLPAYRGYEVSAGVIDGPQSIVFDEAENRLHAQKALLEWLLR